MVAFIVIYNYKILILKFSDKSSDCCSRRQCHWGWEQNGEGTLPNKPTVAAETAEFLRREAIHSNIGHHKLPNPHEESIHSGSYTSKFCLIIKYW